jgi:hypothetical protein
VKITKYILNQAGGLMFVLPMGGTAIGMTTFRESGARLADAAGDIKKQSK